MKKWILNMFLILLLVCNIQVVNAAIDTAIFDRKNMQVNYWTDTLEATDKGNLFLAAYKGDKLVGVGVEPVSKGLNSVSLSAKVTENPDAVKVITLGDGLSPISEMKIKNVAEFDVASLVDFTVEVEDGKDAVILQLTDTQIIDAAQERYEDRLNATLDSYWATDKLEDRCYEYVRETIEAVKPDLIILTGDIVYGEFDDKGTALQGFIEFMEGFDIPWAPVFGNHDNESTKGADWQCKELENAENCLFKQGTLTGNGNYTVGILQNDELKRVFFLLDSNGCSAMSSATTANGHSKSTVGFGNDQIEWYTETAEKIKLVSPNTKLTFAFHIQPLIFKTAYEKYGFTNSGTINNPINIDIAETKADSDFGYLGRDLKSAWDSDFSIYNGIKALGTDSILVGHEHCNSASVVYDGVRFQYGQKSSTYDRANYVQTNGTIVGSYDVMAGTPIVGGTVMILSKDDATISDAYIYYCEDVTVDAVPDAEVTGLTYGDMLTSDASMTVYKARIAGENAYKVIANSQSKLYVDPRLLENKNTFSFSVYLPQSSTSKLDGMGEFAVRIKPNALEGDGYIPYDSASISGGLKLVPGIWKTYTVDISGFENECTEFSFVLPAGNVLYVKDLYIDGEVPSSEVAGLQYETDFTVGSAITVTKEKVDGELAYAVNASSQSKLLVNTALLTNKNKFSFSVYLPQSSTSKLDGMGEFALRIKPNALEGDGYIPYNSSATSGGLKLVHGTWKTYTVDISGFGNKCTEFSFVIPGGNILYFKDLYIE